MGKKITWVGAEGFEEYHGSEEDGTPVDIVAGETVEVSDEKAALLISEFGGLVKAASTKAQVGKPKETEATDAAPTDEA